VQEEAMSASTYSVSFIGDDGHARLTEAIVAMTDDEAVEMAQGKLDELEVLTIADVWRQTERVAIIARQPPLRARYAAE